MMDISNATTLAAAIVALIAPALIQALKKYIPEGFTALTSLGVSLLLGVIAIAATNGFTGLWVGRPVRRRRRRGPGRVHIGEPGAGGIQR